MKMPLSFKLLASVGIALMLQLSAQAHTDLVESSPGDGITIRTGPEHIDLVFTADVKLIKFEVMGVGHEMPTEFTPSSEAMASYRVITPGMHPGAFTVNWAVIGADGHTVANSFSFVVDPDAPEANRHGHDADAEAGHGHDGDADSGHGHGHGDGPSPH